MNVREFEKCKTDLEVMTLQFFVVTEEELHTYSLKIQQFAEWETDFEVTTLRFLVEPKVEFISYYPRGLNTSQSLAYFCVLECLACNIRLSCEK